jgi:hypothetical protein
MRDTISRRLLSVGIAAWLGVAIAGCGSKVSGKYVGASGLLTVTFSSGQATLTAPDGTNETDTYTVSGNTVTINRPQGAGQFTIMPDGSLQGEGMTLTKTSD